MKDDVALQKRNHRSVGLAATKESKSAEALNARHQNAPGETGQLADDESQHHGHRGAGDLTVGGGGGGSVHRGCQLATVFCD